MSEKIPTIEKKEITPEEYLLLAEKLSERAESFPFPSLRGDSYETLKAESDEFPEYATPIDDLIKRFDEEGIKIVVGKNGQVYVLPFSSEDIENDSVFPRHLNATKDMDSDLKRLIEAGPQRSSS